MKFIIDTLKGYQIMPTEHLQNRDLSLKAKGLLSVMYSLPNDWDYSINGLCKITGTGITAIRNIIEELEINGYLFREQTKNHLGQFEYVYHIFFEKRKTKPTKDCLSLRRFKTTLNKIKKKDSRI